MAQEGEWTSSHFNCNALQPNGWKRTSSNLGSFRNSMLEGAAQHFRGSVGFKKRIYWKRNVQRYAKLTQRPSRIIYPSHKEIYQSKTRQIWMQLPHVRQAVKSSHGPRKPVTPVGLSIAESHRHVESRGEEVA